MKKVILVSIVAFIVTIHADVVSAQNRIQAGIKGGLNVCKAYGDDDAADDGNAGFTAGGYISYSIYRRFSLQTEISYTNNGYTYNITTSDTGPYRDLTVFSENSVRLSSLNIPLLGLFEITGNVRVCAGPYMNIFMRGTEESIFQRKGIMRDESTGEWNIVDESGTVSGKIESGSIRRPGFGVMFGAEYVIGKINIGIQYSMGLSNIYNDEFLTVKCRVLKIMLGYQLYPANA